MLSQKSLRRKFFIPLASTVSVLVVIFALMSYQLLKITLLHSESNFLLRDALALLKDGANNSRIAHEIIYLPNGPSKASFRLVRDAKSSTLRLIYPLNNYSEYLLLSRDVSVVMNVLDSLFFSIFAIIALAIFIVIIYSLFISQLFSIHTKSLAQRLAAAERDFHLKLNPEQFPYEFKSICDAINQLIERLQIYNSSQKELFIGIAHELKTPLAVIKAKNDVAMLKPRDEAYYIDVLRHNNSGINQMNKIITEILKIGRNEGATFEQFQQDDLCARVRQLCDNFALLGAKKRQSLRAEISPHSLPACLQFTLFEQIVCNFIQNALKFSPDGAQITVTTQLNDSGEFILQVLDTGPGIDPGRDHFAPFKRFLNSDGIGLGLYLCRIAAALIDAQIGITNRTDAPHGACAWLKMRPKIN